MENLGSEKRINVNYEGGPCYDIVITTGFEGLLPLAKELGISSKKVCIVTETNVASIYLKEITEIFDKASSGVISFVFTAGEASKNLETVNLLYETLIKNRFDRGDMLVALGGGVTGDMTGFAAATYLRGIDFIQIPTSLLSQVDSSIGGKTGVDFKAYKNMVGAFKQPALVYINTHTLNTLDERQFNSGMAEIIKHGLIKDENYFKFLVQNRERITGRDPGTIAVMIGRSVLIKKDVVERDPKEQGERGLLNFGHTFGHAIEKLKDFKLLHGECVAIGIAGACALSRERGLISDEKLSEITVCLKDYGLPVSFDGLEVSEIIKTTKNDKKMESGHIKFILLNGIGNAFIDRTVTDEEMSRALCLVKEDK